MSTIIWIIVAVVIIGLIVYLLTKKKGGEKGDGPTPPEGLSTPPQQPSV